jgi:hypothetical protein
MEATISMNGADLLRANPVCIYLHHNGADGGARLVAPV